MSKDKNIRKRKKREEKKKRIQGSNALKTSFSPDEKVKGRVHLYILGFFVLVVSSFIIYSYSK